MNFNLCIFNIYSLSFKIFDNYSGLFKKKEVIFYVKWISRVANTLKISGAR